MRVRSILPYGSWKSPITAEMISSGSIGLSEIFLDGNDIYWLEMRPNEGGRSVVVRYRGEGGAEDILPPGFNARTSVHEYGGGSYCATGGVVYFANYADQRLYRVSGGAPPEPVTPAGPFRYADLTWDAHRRRILCIQEDHSGSGEPVNSVVAVDPGPVGSVEILASGRDFYAAPRPGPDGESLAFLAWDHPDMPWDASELWLAAMPKAGGLGPMHRIAGGGKESALQPAWSGDGTLYFVSDRTDWWNLYSHREGTIEPVITQAAEFAAPPWLFGTKQYAFLSHRRILCAYSREGLWTLAEADCDASSISALPLPYTEYSSIQCNGCQAVFLAGAPSLPWSVVRLDLSDRHTEVLRASISRELDSAYISSPESIEFPTDEGLTSHGLFYAPVNPEAAAPAGDKPPLLVMIHGGPTSAASTTLRLGIQYYTSRGFAVLDVNYGGSTGFGRAYRERLYGRWGLTDVEDCCAGAIFLSSQGSVDHDRLAIRGGSAGGFTTLACLVFRKVFAAGASHYGVSDCEILARDTHKFEARYLDTLIGPYPEHRELYVERSPINHLDGLDRPVIFFQGLEDKVVPPNQAELMFDALKRRGVPVAYVPFEGEQHGFRIAANIRRAIEGELFFFARIFGIDLADPIEPVPIENL